MKAGRDTGAAGKERRSAMFGMKVKDLALVAFAGGLLAIEVVGLQAAAPAALRSLAGLAGMPAVQSVARKAQVATQSMVSGITNAAAQAAVAGIDDMVPNAVSNAIPSAIGGTAERVAAATPVHAVRIGAHPKTRCSYGFVMVVRGARGARPAADTRLVAWESRVCRAEVRAILAEKRAE